MAIDKHYFRFTAKIIILTWNIVLFLRIFTYKRTVHKAALSPLPKKRKPYIGEKQRFGGVPAKAAAVAAISAPPDKKKHSLIKFYLPQSCIFNFIFLFSFAENNFL